MYSYSGMSRFNTLQMENDENDKIEDRTDEGNPEEQLGESDDIHFIQDYIEKKKLQNRILQEIIENMKYPEKE